VFCRYRQDGAPSTLEQQQQQQQQQQHARRFRRNRRAAASDRIRRWRNRAFFML
jgi:hypothetical protein